jgi:hypothetical protein
MGSSQSRSSDHLKRYSRVASDQLKSVLRRPGRSPQENAGDDEKPQDAGVGEQEVTNGDHDATPIHETEQKVEQKVCLYVICGCVLVTFISNYNLPQCQSPFPVK